MHSFLKTSPAPFHISVNKHHQHICLAAATEEEEHTNIRHEHHAFAAKILFLCISVILNHSTMTSSGEMHHYSNISGFATRVVVVVVVVLTQQLIPFNGLKVS